MKRDSLLKITVLLAISCYCNTMQAQLKTNTGIQYLLSQSKDVSQEFLDLSNTYFFADSLVSLDTNSGKGVLKWKREQLVPRQAFNANTYLHQPLKSLDFPGTAYENDPQLPFSIEPVDERTIRIRILTTTVIPAEVESPMLVGKPANGLREWKISSASKNIVYSSKYGSLTVEFHPWRQTLS